MTTTAHTIISHLHPTPSWELADHPMPTGREENWRFSPLARFAPLLKGDGLQPINWRFVLPAEASVDTICATQARQQSWDAPVDLVAALAVASSGDDVRYLRIDPEAEPVDPILIDVDGQDRTQAGHLLISVGHHAVATIILRHHGRAQTTTKIEIDVAPEASLMVVSLQDWDEGSVHGGQFSLRIGRDARVRTVQASIGKGTVRLVERAEYDGPGGVLEQWRSEERR